MSSTPLTQMEAYRFRIAHLDRRLKFTINGMVMSDRVFVIGVAYVENDRAALILWARPWFWAAGATSMMSRAAYTWADLMKVTKYAGNVVTDIYPGDFNRVLENWSGPEAPPQEDVAGFFFTGTSHGLELWSDTDTDPIEAPTAEKDKPLSSFPHDCPRCQSRAYVGAAPLDIDCTGIDCGFYKVGNWSKLVDEGNRCRRS